jgi:3-phenylpropionate/trans-cinnamate dioxygenase ferredoxin subunit
MKLLVRLDDGREVLILRGRASLRATQARCAHLNVSLADGFHDDRSLFCPAHGIEYDTATGASSCPILSLITYPIRETDGVLWLGVVPGSGHVRESWEAAA